MHLAVINKDLKINQDRSLIIINYTSSSGIFLDRLKIANLLHSTTKSVIQVH